MANFVGLFPTLLAFGQFCWIICQFMPESWVIANSIGLAPTTRTLANTSGVLVSGGGGARSPPYCGHVVAYLSGALPA
jgi:hypothetical protein